MKEKNPNMLRPPNRADGRGSLNSLAALRLDQSGQVEHSEYIVRNSAQLLPMFAIYTVDRHRPGCGCTHCRPPAR